MTSYVIASPAKRGVAISDGIASAYGLAMTWCLSIRRVPSPKFRWRDSIGRISYLKLIGMSQERRMVNYAFIDSQNLNLGVKSQGWLLDFRRLRVFLRDKYCVEKSFLFIGYVPGNQKLYTSLQDAGYICVFKPTLEIKSGSKSFIKGNVDAELVLHSMIELLNYERAVIISGDGDFYCLLEYLSGKNKLAKVIVPNFRYSSLLRRFSKFIVNIQLFREKLQTK